MFDSTGKLPDGIFGNYIDFCDFLEEFGGLLQLGFNCDYLNVLIPDTPGIDISLKGLLTIPLGNTHAFGSYEGCLGTHGYPMSVHDKL